MVQRYLTQLILKKQIQNQTGIMKKILPGDVAKAESKAKFAIESLQNRGNINVNNLTKSDLEFIAEDIVNPLKTAEKTVVKQSAEILPFRFKRSFAEELQDASKKGDFKRMTGIMKVDPKFKEAMKSFNKMKDIEAAALKDKKIIPIDKVEYETPNIGAMTSKEKMDYVITKPEETAEFLKRGKTLDDIIYAQDQYGMTSKEMLDAVKSGKKFPFAGGGIAGMLGEPTYQDDNHRVPLSGGKLAKEGLEAALKEIMEKFGKRSITTASKLERPLKAIEKEKTKAMFDNFTNKINTQEALSRGSKKMRGPIENVNKKPYDMQPSSTDHTTWLQQEKFFDPKALNMYDEKVPANWIEVEKKAAKKLIDDLGPLDVSPNHPNYKDMKAIRQRAKDRLESIKITEALGGNIQMHDWLRMNRKNLNIDDYVIKPGAKKVDDELSGIKLAHIQRKLSPADELKAEFPGISDDLIKNILADKNPQRIAEVKASLREALKMQEKGMPADEIIDIFKNMKRTKNASGGVAGMLGE